VWRICTTQSASLSASHPRLWVEIARGMLRDDVVRLVASFALSRHRPSIEMRELEGVCNVPAMRTRSCVRGCSQMHFKSGSYGISGCYPGVSTTRRCNNAKALPNYTAYRLSRERHRSGVTNVEQRHEPVSHLPHQAKPRIACIRGAATTGIRSFTINDRARSIQNITQLLFVPRQSNLQSHLTSAMPFDISKSREHFPALQQDQVFLDNAGGSQALGSVIDS
jgi:hypothetical protein